ncbi:MAG TPA: type II toxin-antitoxin system VapC family toxin [Thermoanaerobaculia bacterium]|nr:type II toxin-antitoxin system VapC family toxin [Thermoanaerobaculia bacterium]
MKLALDASVLLTIFNQEPGAEAWMDVLVQARRQGLLVLCEVVYAEVAPAFGSRAELEKVLVDLGAHLDPLSAEAAWLAGQTFKRYRLEGGPREHLIPDFLIAAHAKVQADRFAAKDRGYLRRYFPDLAVLRP